MFTRSMMRPFEEQGQKDTETERERERERERGSGLKRGVRRLWQSVKWCARLAAFPVRRSSLNEIVWRPSTAPFATMGSVM